MKSIALLIIIQAGCCILMFAWIVLGYIIFTIGTIATMLINGIYHILRRPPPKRINDILLDILDHKYQHNKKENP